MSLDAVDYALNAYNTPTVGYGGEIDAQLQASVNIREQLTKEGFGFQADGPYRWITSDLRVLFLIGPQTGHAWHPDSKAESSAFIDKALAEADRSPDHLRFVTYTTRFNRAHWLTVDTLAETYQRGEVDARRTEAGKAHTLTTTNINGLTIDGPAGRYTIDKQPIDAGANPSFEKKARKWTLASSMAGRRGSASESGLPAVALAKAGLQKRHGLQGPGGRCVHGRLPVRASHRNAVERHHAGMGHEDPGHLRLEFREVAARRRAGQRRSGNSSTSQQR